MEEELLKNNAMIRGNIRSKNLTLNELTTSCCMVRSIDCLLT